MSQLHILIADGSAIDRHLMSAYAEIKGWKSDTAIDGAEAARRCRIKAYDAIIIDFVLPGMSGPQTVREIRRAPGPNQNTPVLMCSAAEHRAVMQAAAEVGQVAVMSKPMNREDFVAWINRACAGKLKYPPTAAKG